MTFHVLVFGTNGIRERAMATRVLQIEGGASADAFVTLISDITAYPDVQNNLVRWNRARQVVASAKNPDELAHDFT